MLVFNRKGFVRLEFGREEVGFIDNGELGRLRIKFWEGGCWSRGDSRGFGRRRVVRGLVLLGFYFVRVLRLCGGNGDDVGFMV